MLRKMSSNEMQFSQSNNTSINISTKSSNKNSLTNSNKDSKNLNQTKNSNKLGNDFLKCRKWKYIDEENWNEIENKLELIVAKMDQKKYNKIIKDIKMTNLEAIFTKIILVKYIRILLGH